MSHEEISSWDILFYKSIRLYNRTKKQMPMDKTSTLGFNIDGSVIKQALKKEKFPKPSISSLEFLRNFARNFRVQDGIEGDIRELVLN